MTSRACVYLDSNVFIEAFEQGSARADHARWLLGAVEEGRITGVTSELTLAEILVKPLQMGADELAQAYRTMLSGAESFEVVPVTTSVLVEAARVRAERGAIKLPDAIHVATARSRSCAIAVSGDTGMATRDGPRIVPLGPFTIDDLLASGP